VRPIAILLSVSSAALLLCAAAATGMGEDKTTSTVTLKYPAVGTFKGRVGSSNDACINRRVVKLIQRRLRGDVAEISHGISDTRGIWRIALEGELTGYFFVKVKYKRVGSLLCEATHSRTIHVTP
jgi:hypothetical protein